MTDPVGVEEWVSDDLDERTLTYVIPRIDDVVVGGTAEEAPGAGSPTRRWPRRDLARAAALVPALAGATVRAHKVGLRPSRPSVRLEAERRGRQTIVHNYGHGGAGILSWRAPTRWWRWSAVPELRHGWRRIRRAPGVYAVVTSCRTAAGPARGGGREGPGAPPQPPARAPASLARMWSVWLCGRGDG